jgi:hypothetical protein
MNTENTGPVRGVGQAWLGDWRSRLVERLRARGFDSMTGFADAIPQASLQAMAEDLSTNHETGIDRADLCAEQLVQVWRNEAQGRGPEAVERFSRRMLVGELHRDLPEGWRTNWPRSDPATSRLASVTAEWICNHAEEDQRAAERACDAMLDEGRAGGIPPGWLPANADDPLLVEIFRLHWREPR